ncbi:Uncharacterised protein [Mycobacteroides abscessus subsp. abscessus]|nr:Uncharacterised protein [Mycobacteroides abscessus subsp. abscessus]
MTAIAIAPTATVAAARRIHPGTRSATDTPTGASASTGETLYTWWAATAAAATPVITEAAKASGIAYSGSEYAVRASTDCTRATGSASIAVRP